MSPGIPCCHDTGWDARKSDLLEVEHQSVGRIVVIDDDVVEHSNLNGLHGATRSDADNAVPKVDVMARELTRMGLDVEIRSMNGWVDAPHIRDALKSCDVIFG